MVRSIVYVRMNTEYRESTKDTCLSSFLNTFADCRDVLHSVAAGAVLNGSVEMKGTMEAKS